MTKTELMTELCTTAAEIEEAKTKLDDIGRKLRRIIHDAGESL
ncbi:MAG: hypothetical protein Q4F69_02575 [Bacteroidia bacterium]|nr:hypothetical protein [Bacteroidia bacterium]